MSKMSLSTEQTRRGTVKPPDGQDLVKRAATWAKALWQKTHREMGETREAAMYRTAAKYGVEPGTLWSLRYRPPKDILVSVYFKLQAAYDSECEKQEARLAHQIDITRQLRPTPARQSLIDEAEALLGSNYSGPDRRLKRADAAPAERAD